MTTPAPLLQNRLALITGAVCQSGFEVGLVYCWR